MALVDRAKSSSGPVAMLTVFAAFIRLLVVIPTLRSRPFTDMQEYVDRATYLLRTHTFVPDAFRTPLYPLFLAGVLQVGGSLATVRVLQALLGAAMVPLTYQIATGVASRRASILAAAIVAVYPAWIVYPGYILSENLFAPLLLLGLALWSMDTMTTAAAAGVAIGLASLTRAVGVAAILAIPIASMLTGWESQLVRRRTLSRVLLLAAAFVVTLAPWTIRNARLYGRLIPFDTNSGYNFLVGNNAKASGRLESGDWERINTEYWRGIQSDVAKSDASITAAWRYIRAEPGATLALLPRKAAHLIEPDWREHAWIYSTGYFGWISGVLFWPLVVLLWAGFPLLFTAALFGAITSDRRKGMFWIISLILCCGLVGHLLTFGEGRFHLPWVGPLAALAAPMLLVRLETREFRQKLRLGVWIVAVVMLAVLWSSQVSEMLEQAHGLANTPSLPTPWIY